jgi:hypothetical protein
LGAVFVLLLFAVVAYSLARQRDQLADSLSKIGVWPILASFVLACLGVGVTYLGWRTVLTGLRVQLPLTSGARLYFVSQLGKYVPGSIWPILMQMQVGRRYGASRATMAAANLLSLLLGCTAGLLCACVALPLSSTAAVQRYWWVLLALPLLLLVLHPRTVPLVLNTMLRVLRREPVELRLPLRHAVRAGLWSVVSFALLGAHVALLVGPLAGWPGSTLPISVGTISLAVCVGVLAIPVPAGAGVRDAVIVVALSPVLGTTPALLVAVSSRLLISAADGVLALASLAFKQPPGESVDRHAPRCPPEPA